MGTWMHFFELSSLKLLFSTIYEILNKAPPIIPSSYPKDLQNLISQLLEKDYNKKPTNPWYPLKTRGSEEVSRTKIIKKSPYVEPRF